MKTRKAELLTLLGMMALLLATITTLAPNPSVAQGSGTKQYVGTWCTGGWGCNDCDPGSKICTDHTCSECEPPEQ